MSTLIWAWEINIISKVIIYITYIPWEFFHGKRESGKRNYVKWNFRLQISHRIQLWLNLLKIGRQKWVKKVVIVLWLTFMTHRTWKTSIIFTGFDHSLWHYKITASSSSVWSGTYDYMKYSLFNVSWWWALLTQGCFLSLVVNVWLWLADALSLPSHDQSV